LDESCSDATHVITRARFGALNIEAEGPRAGDAPPERWSITRPGSTDTLIDVTLAPVGPHATRRVCMGLTKYRKTFVPPPFLSELYVSAPLHCDATCDNGGCACSAGHGDRCAIENGVSDSALRQVCEFGGDRSAEACAELSRRSQGAAALEFAWQACERGRQACDSTAQLLSATNAKTDPRFERALRYACASGNVESCCAWGDHQLDHPEIQSGAVDLVRNLCAEGKQLCCASLKAHGRSAPARRRQPN
jgi:hypothetical protein